MVLNINIIVSQNFNCSAENHSVSLYTQNPVDIRVVTVNEGKSGAFACKGMACSISNIISGIHV